MKIIKLLLLLTFGLWSDFELDMPSDGNAFNEISNKLLEKTLVSFNKKIQNDVSIYNLESTILSMHIFLNKISCSTVEMENTIQDNLFTTIYWNKALEKGKENFIKTVISSAKVETMEWKVINTEKYIIAIEDIILQEIEAYNLRAIMAIKKNVKYIDENMSRYTQEKAYLVDKLSIEIKDKMNKYTNKQDFLKELNNTNKLIKLKGINAAIVYMYSMVSFDNIIESMKNLNKRQFNLLETCVQ